MGQNGPDWARMGLSDYNVATRKAGGAAPLREARRDAAGRLVRPPLSGGGWGEDGC